jgi:hypothetical protein
MHEAPVSEPKQVADARLQEALDASGSRDPREFYREQLKALREQDEEAYRAAVAYYRDTLIPSIADGSAEPLPAWTLYGKRLAELAHEGRTVAVDASGRSKAWEGWDPTELVLHLPEEARTRALLVQLPPRPSDAQRATYSWLVAGRNKLPDA